MKAKKKKKKSWGGWGEGDCGWGGGGIRCNAMLWSFKGQETQIVARSMKTRKGEGGKNILGEFTGERPSVKTLRKGVGQGNASGTGTFERVRGNGERGKVGDAKKGGKQQIYRLKKKSLSAGRGRGRGQGRKKGGKRRKKFGFTKTEAEKFLKQMTSIAR